ncbi:PAS domain S-box protein [Oscillatoria sp. FACHB-1406]|uniref:PAS domain S-box protein n=1 Tax=Oscillatoria sp. FACHB-1406 TaxID=2692846 RepID=UPI001685EA48|nr:PAS domain S-box protein [Oscillatoria sp. FACHB-1406]MBD2577753.1 PAS domain S-box protein [Oscillatoria sp. FACHB-1406]
MSLEKKDLSVSSAEPEMESEAKLTGSDFRVRETKRSKGKPFSFRSDVVLMTDAKERFVLISPNVERFFGYTVGEVKAFGTIEKLFGQGLQEIEGQMAGQEKGRLDRALRDKMGRERWFEIEVKLLSAPEGGKLYLCRDISDRKKLESERDRLANLLRAKNAELARLKQKLHQEKHHRKRAESQAKRKSQLFDAVIENIPYAIFVKEVQNLKFVYSNPAAEKLLGCSEQELLDKTDRDLFSPEIADRIIAEDRAFLASGATHQTVEETLPTSAPSHDSLRDRQQTRLQTQKILISNPRGVPEYLLKISFDLTAIAESEQALQRSEATNRALLSAIPDLMFRVSRDGTYLDCQETKALHAVLPSHELIGKTFREVLPPKNAELGMENIEQALKGEKVETCEYQLSDNDGKMLDYESRTVACGEDEVLVLVRDISDRKSAEQALKASENRFRAIFEQAAMGIILFGSDGSFCRANQKFCEIVGYSSEELRSLNEIELTEGEDRALYQSRLQKLSSGECFSCSMEKRYRHKNGESIWVNFTASLLREGSDSQQYLVAVIQDIRDRIFAETSLQEVCTNLQAREAQYKILTDRVPVGIFQTNSSQDIVFVNPFWCKLTGMTPTEAYGKGWMQALHPEDRDRVLSEWAKEPERRDRNSLFRFQRQTDGQVFWVLGNSTSLRDAEGRYQGEIGTVLEVTQHKQAEDHLKRQAERERSIGAMQERVRRSLELDTILTTTVEEVRQFLQNDRVLIYRFNPDWSGAVVAESVREPWIPVLGQTVRDPCFRDELVQAYKNGRIQVLNDLQSANLTPCHYRLLEHFQISANLVVPIFQGDNLWGLLVAHHCEAPHLWQQAEIDFLKQLATQVGIATQQSQLYQKLKEANQKLHHLATVDSLTQVANRRCFDAYLQAEWRRMTREKSSLSLILCDIDYFKLYNDTYGHPAGDRCLRRVATALRRTLKRPADLVARYGGEEFAIVLPHTDEQGMRWIAELLRQAVKRLNIEHSASPVCDRVTLSLGGVALVPTRLNSWQALIDGADRALYQAKKGGRDRVAVYKD